ncbi:MAG: sigma factor-like helix-turn-helix DNA-binding protein, partial [Candidatus Bilamarchaeaceae archaeon]
CLIRCRAQIEREMRLISFDSDFASDMRKYIGWRKENPEAQIEDFALSSKIGLKRAKSMEQAFAAWNESTSPAEAGGLFYSQDYKGEEAFFQSGIAHSYLSGEGNCDSFPQHIATREISAKLRDAIDSLPPKEKSAVLSRHFSRGGPASLLHAKNGAADYVSALSMLKKKLDPEGMAGDNATISRMQARSEFVASHQSHLALLAPEEELALRLFFGIGIPFAHRLEEISEMTGKPYGKIKSDFEKAAQDAKFAERWEADGSAGLGCRHFLIQNIDLADALSERERSVLRMRYGLGATRQMKLAEVAEALPGSSGEKISRERVRQIEQAAFGRVAFSAFARLGEGALKKYLNQNRMLFKKILTPAEQEAIGDFLRRGNSLPANKAAFGSALSKMLDCNYPLQAQSASNPRVPVLAGLLKFVSENYGVACMLPQKNRDAIFARLGIGQARKGFREIGEDLGIPEDDARVLFCISIALLFEKMLEKKADEERGRARTLRDFIEENSGLATGLTQRQMHFLKLRFGLEGERPHSLEEISAKIGIKKARAQNLETESLCRIISMMEGGIPAFLKASAAALRSLSQEKRFILEQKNGLGGAKPATLAQIRQMLGGNRSISMVRKLHDDALKETLVRSISLENALKGRAESPLAAFLKSNPRLLEPLDGKERRALELRLGIFGERPLSFAQISERFAREGHPISRQAASHRYYTALVKVASAYAASLYEDAEAPHRSGFPSTSASARHLPAWEATILRLSMGDPNWPDYTITEIQQALGLGSYSEAKCLVEDAYRNLGRLVAIYPDVGDFNLKMGRELRSNPAMLSSLPARLRSAAAMEIEEGKRERKDHAIGLSLGVSRDCVKYLRLRACAITARKGFGSKEPLCERALHS